MYKSFELDLNDSDKWQEYLERIPEPQRDIYFSPDYYRLYEKLGDGIAKCFIVTNGKETALYPYLMNAVDKKKYNLEEDYYDIQGAYGYNGTIYTSLNDEVIAAFDEAFNQYCLEKKILAEFTRFHPLLKNREFSKNRMKIIDDRETVYLALGQEIDDLWKDQFSSQVRNKIRKAHKRGYSSEVLKNPEGEDIQTFIEIYRGNMEMVNADEYFYFNSEYFENTFKYLPGHSYLMNIKNEQGEIISSTILFKYGDYFHYHLSGRTRDAISWASNFLYSESINLAKDLGAKFYHFGGGRTGNPKDSLLRFKKGFSNTSSIFTLGKKIYYPEVYNSIEKQWNSENPHLEEEYRNFLLKYRVENV
ncbi:GNAT family N-acetyltransferase [Salinimicrobium sp. HB62]|uniref:GNAT family N-acetyltransferase n=1 Tax=Salinimicrobium sp. HB62 TaxID=3077781 RepID=UPI002D78304B|nr:GNAT family N-acetyltransferase [Salinimicrobium sp. HB62]